MKYYVTLRSADQEGNTGKVIVFAVDKELWHGYQSMLQTDTDECPGECRQVADVSYPIHQLTLEPKE